MSRRRVAKAPQEISVWPFAGMIAMAAVLFLYGASALVAPWWAFAALIAVWLLLFVQCCRWWTPHPRRIAVVAGFAAVLWFATLVAGAALLDWSA